jgi:hypothetical protein
MILTYLDRARQYSHLCYKNNFYKNAAIANNPRGRLKKIGYTMLFGSFFLKFWTPPKNFFDFLLKGPKIELFFNRTLSTNF